MLGSGEALPRLVGTLTTVREQSIMKIEWAEIGTGLGWLAAGVSFLYGIFKGFTDVSSLIDDLRDRRNPEYRDGYKVKSTIDKTVIKDDLTESIRLRTVRAYRRVPSLRIDHRPEVVGPDGTKRPATVSSYYAFPGRARETDDGKYQIDLMEDEALKARRDYPVVLGYVMQEKRDVLFNPPWVSVEPPVGSESLVIEVHFPPRCLVSLDVKNKPETRVYSKDPNTKEENDIPAEVISPDRTWIRARINKPPQKREIFLEWRWRCA